MEYGKHELITRIFSFRRLIISCKCKKFNKQYISSSSSKENYLLQIEVYTDYLNHLKEAKN